MASHSPSLARLPRLWEHGVRIYTRTGDEGETGLFGGQRVRKDDARVEAYGAVDELNSLLGVARAQGADSDLDCLLARIQSKLLDVGADLATPLAEERHGAVTITRLPAEVAAALEAEIDRLDAELEPLRRFILPGGAPLAAALHHARTVCRRAERRCVTLRSLEPGMNPEVVRYLNRLSDLLFVMARAANARAGMPDVEWQPGGETEA